RTSPAHRAICLVYQPVDTIKPEMPAKAVAIECRHTCMKALRRLRLRWIGHLVGNPIWCLSEGENNEPLHHDKADAQSLSDWTCDFLWFCARCLAWLIPTFSEHDTCSAWQRRFPPGSCSCCLRTALPGWQVSFPEIPCTSCRPQAF